MRTWFSRLGLNARLGLLACAFGAIALFAQPLRGTSVTIDAAELSAMVTRGADHVGPRDLADWLIAGRSDFRLLDLRGAAEFAEYHIPGAESAPLATLASLPLDRTERIVLYSEGEAHASQAWMLLRAEGFTAAYALTGGLDAWKDDVLFPRLAEATTPEQRAANETLARVSAHFGGRPRVEGAPFAQAQMELPTVASPVSAPAGAGKAPAKKKKEGC